MDTMKEKPVDTSNVNFSDIYNLAKPENFESDNFFTRTNEIAYSIGPNLKRYAGCDKNYKIKAFFEHGPTFSKTLDASFRVHESLPSIVSSDFRKKLIKSQKNNNGVYAIGPFIAYAEPLLNEEETIKEKERLANNLLIFPAHSTMEAKQNYNIDNFCEKIKKIGENYDSIRICLHWKDVLNGYGEKYEKYGFEVVTAGYSTDPFFLNRLRSIIECSSVTMSNKIGTHVSFTIYLKRPHYIIPTEELNTLEADNTTITQKAKFKLQKEIEKTINYNDLNRLETLLTEKNPNKEELYELLNKYFGFNEVKSKKELKDIIIKCEKSYSSIRFYLNIIILIKNSIITALKTL